MTDSENFRTLHTHVHTYTRVRYISKIFTGFRREMTSCRTDNSRRNSIDDATRRCNFVPNFFRFEEIIRYTKDVSKLVIRYDVCVCVRANDVNRE